MDRRPQDTTTNAYNSISPSSIPPSRPSLLASSPLHSPHPTVYTHHPPPSSDSHSIPHGETWMDFIRNQPSQQQQQQHYHHHLQQQPSSRAESSPSSRLPSLPDRKRRFSSLNQSPESASYSSSSRHPAPGLNSSHIHHRSRPNTYTPYTSHMATRPHASSLPGSSTAPSRVVIDLTGDNYNTDNTRSSNRVRSSTASANSPGGVILPPWQPDSDVTFCPVCANQFTFWYRKHHCRRCGRVVCANCSPHRITIPRQFIVQPPATEMAYEEGFPSAITSWGGETVRVCNPCVPDPNLSPPGSRPFTNPQLPFLPLPLGGPQNSPPQWQSGMPPGLPPGFLPPYPQSQQQSQPPPPYHPNQPPSLQNPPLPHHTPNWYAPAPAPPPIPPSALHTRSSSSAAALPSPSYQPPPPFYIPSQAPPRTGNPSQRPPILHPAPLPRRQIPEEDECPICGEELPPKDNDGGTEEREAHVENCIKDHMYSSTPTASDAVQQQAQRSGGESSRDSVAGSSGSNSNPILISSSPRPSGSRPRRMTGGRMLVYKATEKDCVGDDSLAVECVICFEEFEVADDMGRLECLCKFHRKCIRDWWETKGAGTCPTHQLHD